MIAGPTDLSNILFQLVALGAIPDINAGRKIIQKAEEKITYYPETIDKPEEKHQCFAKQFVSKTQ